MNLHTFLTLLLASSILTGLATEAVKRFLDDLSKKYYSNIVAGIVAAILSLAIGVGYLIIAETPFTATIAVYLIALIFLSWLCAMVGYDKVVQAITQIQKGND